MSNSRGERWLGAAIHLEEQWDSLRRRLSRRLNAAVKHTVVPYVGYGSIETGVRIRGRVLEGMPPLPPGEDDSAWENLIAAYRRLESDEVAFAKVEIALDNQQVRAVADGEGYFDVTLPAVRSAEPWREGLVRLLEPSSGAELVEAPVRALVPSAADYVVVSDIDDTILVSEVTNPVRAARLLLFSNARSRLTFPGVSDFYRALQRGAGPSSFNPICYVSSSPWNLYDLLTDFMEIQGIPTGPLLLRDYGLDAHTLQSADNHGYKLARIGELLATWPTLPFVLIGDSGQQDPEIYTSLAEQNRDRIRAVYIRDVGDETRDAGVRALAASVKAQGIPLLLFSETAEAHTHARSLGLVLPG